MWEKITSDHFNLSWIQLLIVIFVVSVPPHVVRTNLVSRDIALNQFYATWRVFTDYLTFGDEDCGLREENQGQRRRKSAKSTAKTSKHLGDRKFRRIRRKRKQENAKENSRRDHVLGKKSCQIRQHQCWAN